MSKYVIAALNDGGYVLLAPWFPAENPGDDGGVDKHSAPVMTEVDIFPTLEQAQERWRKLMRP